MNSRRARRLATTRLAAAARLLASQADRLDEHAPADRARLCQAFEALARELETRAGIIPRTSPTPPVDPGQVALFMIEREREDETDGPVRSETPQ